uniref:Uncharacterized protein n=1 Tax=Tetranychus urticae TaxID=32264 RepID=T1JWS4_TETUR
MQMTTQTILIFAQNLISCAAARNSFHQFYTVFPWL